MKIAQAILLGFVSITAASDQVKPSAPVWPKVFSQNFNDTNIFVEDKYQNAKGEYFYDVSDTNNTLTRIDLDNGQNNIYCAENSPGVTSKCSQFVSNGDRYVYKPEHDDCCYCCSADQGCGVLDQDWMKGDYIGTKKIGEYDVN